MNDPKKLDDELEQLITEEMETLDKLETISLYDIVDEESEGNLHVTGTVNPSLIRITESDFEVDNDDPIFANFSEQFE